MCTTVFPFIIFVFVAQHATLFIADCVHLAECHGYGRGIRSDVRFAYNFLFGLALIIQMLDRSYDAFDEPASGCFLFDFVCRKC